MSVVPSKQRFEEKRLKRVKNILNGLGGSLGLALSSAGAVFAGSLVSVLMAKLMSPLDYGSYCYAINIYTLVATLGSFGVFYTGSKMILARNNSQDIGSVYGLSALFILFVSLFSFLVVAMLDVGGVGVFRRNEGYIFALFVPGVITILLMACFENLLPADNRVGLLAVVRLAPKMLHLIAISLIFFIFMPPGFGVKGFLVLYFSLMILFYFFVFYFVGLRFEGVISSLDEFFTETRKYGVHVYVGSIVAVGGTALTGVIVGYFGESTKEVAYFSLATSLCSPLSIISGALTASGFRGFSESDKIPRHLLVQILILTAIPALILCLLSSEMVSVLWGNGYAKVSSYVYCLSLAFLLYGLGDAVGRFLAAKGKGVALRNASFVVGGVLIAGSFFLVKISGGIGAAYARVLAGVFYVGVIFLFYWKEFGLGPSLRRLDK